jgi:hypothetical protein
VALATGEAQRDAIFYAPYRQLGLTAFVVSESNGRWGQAQPVRGLPGRTASNPGGYLNTLSCPSAGNCAGGGYFTQGEYGFYYAFVVSERNGEWGEAEAAPGTTALNLGGDAAVSSVSCPSAIRCVAAGSYTDDNGKTQAFVGGG